MFFLAILLFACKNEQKNNTSKKHNYKKELLIKIDSAKISGTLTMPDSTRNYPLMIIVAGSGPTDRDGNNNLGIKTFSYKYLSDTLANENIATFRYDKRGVAKSQVKGLKEQDLVFETYVDDLIEIINYFKKNEKFTEIILLGHSEGALVAAVACSKTEISKFISVAGTAKPADSILIEQLSNKSDIDISKVKKIINNIKKGQITPVFDKNLAAIFRPSVQPYLASWMKFNPVNIYSKIQIPVLIIHGKTDVQIPVSDAYLLDSACVNSKIIIIEKMNHILKNASADTTKNLETYKKANLPLNKVLIKKIIQFIKN